MSASGSACTTFMLRAYLTIMLGGALGTGLRFCLSSWMATKWGETFPIGTLLVNVTGSFAISFFAGLAGPDGRFLVSPLTRQFVTIGIMGGYTTFSSFSLQTLALMNDGQWARAGANVGLSVALCLLAVWLGQAAANVLNQR